MTRERKTIVMQTDAAPGSQIFDQLGRIVGQVLRCEQRSDAAWDIEMDVDDDTDLERLQVMPTSGVTGSING
jgi:hypothetical protein